MQFISAEASVIKIMLTARHLRQAPTCQLLLVQAQAQVPQCQRAMAQQWRARRLLVPRSLGASGYRMRMLSRRSNCRRTWMTQSRALPCLQLGYRTEVSTTQHAVRLHT
jgi:hypothetical protein